MELLVETNKEKIECFNCHKPLNLEMGEKIMRSEECPHCYASLRSCKMCQFYDITAYNECREPSADRIVEKESSNFCDYFILKGEKKGLDKDNIVNSANALFKS